MYCISGNVFFKSEGLVAGVVIQVVHTSSSLHLSQPARQPVNMPARQLHSQPANRQASSTPWVTTNQPASQPTLCKHRLLFLTVNECFSSRFGHPVGVRAGSGATSAPDHVFTRFYPRKSYPKHTPNSFKKMKICSLFSRTPKKVFKDMISMNPKPTLKEKRRKRHPVQRNNHSFLKNGGCLNSSPLSNRIAVAGVLGWQVSKISALLCKSCSQSHGDGIYFREVGHLAAKGRPGQTPLGPFFEHWKHSGKKTENRKQMC